MPFTAWNQDGGEFVDTESRGPGGSAQPQYAGRKSESFETVLSRARVGLIPDEGLQP